MDMEAGANPFGHSCLIFSKQLSASEPVEVSDSIGFYSQPSTTTHPLTKAAKNVLGFQIDLQDGHGLFKQEVVRDLDGPGLNGFSFEVSLQQFEKMTQNYQEIMKSEQEAITELNSELTAKGIVTNGYTRHVLEKEKAKNEGRKPRLLPFHVTMEFNANGFDTTASHTCKDRSLGFLLDNGVIDESIKQKISSSHYQKAFPRYSSYQLMPFRLVSLGEPEEHVSKKTKTVFYNRTWGQNKLVWATPIRTLESIQAGTIKDDHHDDLKIVLRRTRDIELMLLKKIRVLSDTLEDKMTLMVLKAQLTKVQALYSQFAYVPEYDNQDLFENKLVKAQKVLNTAVLSLDLERLNYPFLLKVYDSLTAQETFLSTLTTFIAISLMVAAPLLSNILLSSAAQASARRARGFFREDQQPQSSEEVLQIDMTVS